MIKKYIIDNKKIIRNIIISTALVSSIINVPMLSQIHSKEKNGEELYNQYSVTYLNTLDDLDYNIFDKNFIEIYREGKYYINQDEYDVSELYIVTTENGGNHIIKAGENKRDIITGQIFEEKMINVECLRKTSIFYKMYQDGIISTKEIKIDKNTLNKYVEQWDGENQYEVPELIADKKARERIKSIKN